MTKPTLKTPAEIVAGRQPNGMQILLKLLFLALVSFNLFLGSWYVLHNDISFTSDIARDFLLFREVDVKKIVLIGPHSSSGLFHGPLWTYLNYPAYVIGHGNPVAVGWFWMILVVVFLISNYYIAKRLFNTTVAYLFVLLESVYMGFHAHEFINPHGAMLVIPAFFYCYIRYRETLRLRYLFMHLLFASAMVQFQMAIGIPFMILSFLAILATSFRSGKKAHILAYLLLAIPLGNFIIFDIRHDFLLSRLVLGFLSPQQGGHSFNYLSFAYDRVRLLFSSVEIVRSDRGYRNLVFFLMLLFVLYRQVKDNAYKMIYLSFLYFYAGFFVLSIIDKGPLLYFYLYPLFPFVHLIFASLVTSRYKPIALIIILVVFVYNVNTLIYDVKVSGKFIGVDIYSWKFLNTMVSNIYKSPEKEFGYFVFTPDTVGYGPKYAMLYAGSIYHKPAASFQKKPITYVLIEPHPFFKIDWWKTNKAHLTGEPIYLATYPNGYKVEKYKLTKEEINVAPEPDIDPGIFFR